MSAARLLLRWNLRMVRQERRQHGAFLALITIAVMLSVAGILTAFHLVEPPENTYGTAEVIVSTTGDPGAAEQALVDQGHRFGVIRSVNLAIDGAAERLPIRVQDPSNEVTGPLLALLEGRWPSAAGEVAPTDGVALDGATVGNTVTIDGASYTVVGLVENPTDLADEFVLVWQIDQFGVSELESNTQFLVDAQPAEVTFPAGSGRITLASRASLLDVRTAVALAVSAVAAVAMLEVALLVGAGFAVLARRRSRQYGLLGAAGATPGQLRTAATLGGTVLGLVGAVAGALLGIAIAGAVAPGLETTVGHRIAFAVPWWTVLPTVLVAATTASIAARWPSRPLSKQPVAHLLASLRPRPAPVGRSAVAGVALTIAGSVAIVAGFARLSTPLAVVGIVLAPVGLLLMSPLLVRMIGRLSGRLPMAARIGGRAIARHNRRSAAVVAALAIALGIPIGLAVVSESIDQYNLSKAPNLDDNTIIAWVPGTEQSTPHIPAELRDQPDGGDARKATVARLAGQVAGARVVPIEVAVSPDALREQENFDRIGPQAAVVPLFAVQRGKDCFNCDIFAFGERDESGAEILYRASDAWVGSPELLQLLGADPIDRSATAASREAGTLAAGLGGLVDSVTPGVVIDDSLPPATSIAPLLLAPEAVAAAGLDRVTIGWMIVSAEPLTAEIRSAVTEAAGSELFAEFAAKPTPQSTLRLIGFVVGMIVALGIAASAVGLLTAESADDVRILESVGASPRTAGLLAASVAAILAMAGAAIAVFIGYLALLPLLTIEDTSFPFVVPWTSLAGFLLVFPMLAALVGLLSNRRTSTNLARPS